MHARSDHSKCTLRLGVTLLDKLNLVVHATPDGYPPVPPRKSRAQRASPGGGEAGTSTNAPPRAPPPAGAKHSLSGDLYDAVLLSTTGATSDAAANKLRQIAKSRGATDAATMCTALGINLKVHYISAAGGRTTSSFGATNQHMVHVVMADGRFLALLQATSTPAPKGTPAAAGYTITARPAPTAHAAILQQASSESPPAAWRVHHHGNTTQSETQAQPTPTTQAKTSKKRKNDTTSAQAPGKDTREDRATEIEEVSTYT